MTDIVKELVYYCRDEDMRPTVTVMLLVDSAGNVARGYAVCSDRETPVTKEDAGMRNGPGLARKRAVRAMMAYKTMSVKEREMVMGKFRIMRDEPVRILSRMSGVEDLLRISGRCKASFIPRSDAQRLLTAYERKILRSNGLK